MAGDRMMNDEQRLANLHAMTFDELHGEMLFLLANEKRLAEMSAAEIQFFDAKGAEWRAEAARLDAESAAMLAEWTPAVSGASGRSSLQ